MRQSGGGWGGDCTFGEEEAREEGVFEPRGGEEEEEKYNCRFTPRPIALPRFRPRRPASSPVKPRGCPPPNSIQQYMEDYPQFHQLQLTPHMYIIKQSVAMQT